MKYPSRTGLCQVLPTICFWRVGMEHSYMQLFPYCVRRYSHHQSRAGWCRHRAHMVHKALSRKSWPTPGLGQ